VATRAGVSEADFHAVFAGAEDCYKAAFEQGVARLAQTLVQASAREQAWLERVRSGLVALLGFFDDEPAWARLLLLDTPLAVEVTFACTRELHELLAGLLSRDAETDGHRGAGRMANSSILRATLTGELVVGGVFSVIRTSLLADDLGTLVELAPSLMAFIVAPYLGQAAAQAELEGRPVGGGGPSTPTRGVGRAQAISRASQLPIRATHRTTLVLGAIARAPYSNNREIAQAAGLVDEGQTSKLLARLERQGVIENVGVGAARGEPNAWLLTAEGRRVLELLGESFDERAPRRREPNRRRAGGPIGGVA
jgi:AcrR family transcriptional regulator